MPSLSPRTFRRLLLATAMLAGAASIASILVIVTAVQRPAVTASTVGGPFTLTDHNGKTLSDKDLNGRPFLVFFGFTHCPDICPTTLFEVSEVLRKLGPDTKARGLFITVDPERDTPAVLKDYLSSFDPNLIGLTGSRDEIDRVIKAYRGYARKVPREDGEYTMDHTAFVYLMDKQGRFVTPFNLRRKPEDAAEDFRRYF